MEERNGRDSPKEYKIDDLRDSNMKSSRSSSRMAMIEHELGSDSTPSRFSRENVINGLKGFSQGFVIYPDDRLYKLWEKFILIWAIYSTFFTPMEFAFFKGLPRKLFLLDICGQIAFLVDIVIQFFVAYRDSQTYKMVCRRNLIALRYLKSHFILDVLSCMPWDNIYKVMVTYMQSIRGK